MVTTLTRSEIMPSDIALDVHARYFKGEWFIVFSAVINNQRLECVRGPHRYYPDQIAINQEIPIAMKAFEKARGE